MEKLHVINLFGGPGTEQTIYFNNEEEVAHFSNHMKTHVGLDKHIVTDYGEFVGVGEIKPFEIKETVG
jgi:hypothetical protein